MSNIDIANKFFTCYASASKAQTESDKVKAYEGMHKCLDKDVTFSDMAYKNIKGKQVFAMWHWFCTKKPDPVKVTFDPSETREKDGAVILVYRAQYIFGYDENDPSKKGNPIDYKITANLTFEDGQIIHHKDEADIKEWAKQALGSLASTFSWTLPFKIALRYKATKLLDDFMKANNYA